MNIPNTLSLARLCMIPIFVWVFFLPVDNAHRWAALVFVLAFLTDVLDGFLARKLNQITKLGRFLDPLADKLMTLTALVCVSSIGLIPTWAVVLFFLKEATMALGGLVMFRRINDLIGSNWWGKAATGVFSGSIFLMLLFPIPPSTATLMITVALVLALAAFIRYIFAFREAVPPKKLAEK